MVHPLRELLLVRRRALRLQRVSQRPVLPQAWQLALLSVWRLVLLSALPLVLRQA